MGVGARLSAPNSVTNTRLAGLLVITRGNPNSYKPGMFAASSWMNPPLSQTPVLVDIRVSVCGEVSTPWRTYLRTKFDVLNVSPVSPANVGEMVEC